MKVEYNKEQAYQVLKDYNNFHFPDGKDIDGMGEDFLSHKFPENNHIGKVCENNDGSVFYCSKEVDNTLYGFGFFKDSKWFCFLDENSSRCASNREAKKLIKEADLDDWISDLKSYAIEKGYKSGVEVVPFPNEERKGIMNDICLLRADKPNIFKMGGVVIMKNGEWAPIVKNEDSEPEQDLTPEQANDALQRFAKWFGDNYKNLK